MNAFDDLGKDWQSGSRTRPDFGTMKKMTWREEHMRQMFWSGAGLVAVAMFLIYAGVINSSGKGGATALVSVVIAAATALVYGIINISNFQKLRGVSETDSPGQHLSFWRNYFAARMRFVRRAGPLFFILINVAFMLQLPRVLSLYPSLVYQASFCLLYVLLMLYIWFSPGRALWQKEQEKYRGIVMGYERMLGQLRNE